MNCRLSAPLLLFIAIAPVVLAEEPPPDLGTRPQGVDWADFLGPRRDSCSPETGIVTDWAAHPPRIVWQCELGASYSAPSISRGRLFHFDRYGDVHRLTCRNAETGAELWKYELPADFSDMLGYNNGPRATPVIDGNRVYVMSPEGQLHCVTVDGGKKVWSVDTTAEFGVVKNFFGVGSTPVVWRDLLIANIGGSPEGSPTDVYAAGGQVEGNGTGVVAFDKLTGKIRWKATDELASYASPVVADLQPRALPGGSAPQGSTVTPPPGTAGGYKGERCFVFARGGLMMLDPATGKVDFDFPWRATKLESVNASSPVVVGDEVFISEAYGPGSALLNVAEFLRNSDDAASPSDKSPPDEPTAAKMPVSEKLAYRVVWQDELRSREKAMELHWNTAVFHEGHLYGSSGQHGGSAELRCIEWATGKVKWREPRLTRSSLLYADGHFVCLSEDGALRLLKATPERYKQVAEFTPKGVDGEPLLTYPAWAAPVLSHGLLYVRGSDRLVCLELIPRPANQ
ncbi:MAG: PQQ-like beta-propeller repeat protein [Pirellulales bacterium]|nr:PQQ-like beta-propeller repeat protein [Pirellulales bacterium]